MPRQVGWWNPSGAFSPGGKSGTAHLNHPRCSTARSSVSAAQTSETARFRPSVAREAVQNGQNGVVERAQHVARAARGQRLPVLLRSAVTAEVNGRSSGRRQPPPVRARRLAAHAVSARSVAQQRRWRRRRYGVQRRDQCRCSASATAAYGSNRKRRDVRPFGTCPERIRNATDAA